MDAVAATTGPFAAGAYSDKTFMTLYVVYGSDNCVSCGKTLH